MLVAGILISSVKVSRRDSITARHSSSGRQPHFAALDRGRHLYSAVPAVTEVVDLAGSVD